MQYLGADSMVLGTPEACPECGRDMLAFDQVMNPSGCTPTDYAMCWGPK